MDLGLQGKTALVTGGTHGIGLAIAKALYSEGCTVAVCARGRAGLQLARQEGFRAIRADVHFPEHIDRVISKPVEHLGGLNILVNNVGGLGRAGEDRPEATEASVWDDVYERNAGAARRFTMLAIPHMLERKWGRVVTIASIHGREAGGRPWFAAAKAAEIAMMKALSKDQRLVRAGITFNSVAPGSIMIEDTGWAATRDEKPEEYSQFLTTLPLGRLGTAEEVAQVVTFLCSEGAKYVNGACVVVDGGEGAAL